MKVQATFAFPTDALLVRRTPPHLSAWVPNTRGLGKKNSGSQVKSYRNLCFPPPEICCSSQKRDCQCRRLNPAFSDVEHLKTRVLTYVLSWIILFLNKMTKSCSPNYELHFATLSCLDEDGNQLRVSRAKYSMWANSSSEEVAVWVICTQHFL